MMPAMTVRPTETAMSVRAVRGESWAMFSTLNEEYAMPFATAHSA